MVLESKDTANKIRVDGRYEPFAVSEDEFTTRRFDTSSSINDSNQYRQYKCRHLQTARDFEREMPTVERSRRR